MFSLYDLPFCTLVHAISMYYVHKEPWAFFKSNHGMKILGNKKMNSTQSDLACDL